MFRCSSQEQYDADMAAFADGAAQAEAEAQAADADREMGIDEGLEDVGNK
jgi:hypothetical protein